MRHVVGKKFKQAFTLIELLVVVAIIGILATVVVVNVSSTQKKARVTKTVADLVSIEQALKLVKNDFSRSVWWSQNDPEICSGDKCKISVESVNNGREYGVQNVAKISDYLGAIPNPSLKYVPTYPNFYYSMSQTTRIADGTLTNAGCHAPTNTGVSIKFDPGGNNVPGNYIDEQTILLFDQIIDQSDGRYIGKFATNEDVFCYFLADKYDQ